MPLTELELCGILYLMRKGTSEILKIADPAQRLVAAIIFQAFGDIYYSPTPEIVADAEEFLRSGGGVWNDFVDYDISELYRRYVEEQ